MSIMYIDTKEEIQYNVLYIVLKCNKSFVLENHPYLGVILLVIPTIAYLCKLYHDSRHYRSLQGLPSSSVFRALVLNGHT